MKLVALGIAALILVLAIGVGAWAYAADRPRAELEAVYLKSSGYIDVAGIRLRVADSGPRDAPALILLHGLGSSLETWEPWAAALSTKYRVIRFDLPGFGLTGPDPSGDYSDARAGQILVALMDHLGLRQAVIGGNSLGGRIAWRFAVEHADRVAGLVLISPDGFASPGFEYGRKPEVGFTMRLLPYVLPRAMLKMNLAAAYGDPKRLTDATIDRYRDLMLAPGVRRALLDRTEQVLLEDPVPLLRGIRAPTLLLWGERDGLIPFANATDYLKSIAGAKLVSFPELGHVPFEEDPKGSLPPLQDFLAALTPTTAP